jgi:hypothetical protein
MTPTEKLARVAKLSEELQDETNDVIVQSRIEGLAKEMKVNPFQCGLIYWALKEKGEFYSIFGPDVKVRFRAR